MLRCCRAVVRTDPRDVPRERRPSGHDDRAQQSIDDSARTGRHRDAADEAFLASRIELARISLGELGHATAATEGKALEYDTAINEMRSWLTEIGPITRVEAVARRVAESSQNVRASDDTVALTPREREILSLVARGFSNGDIAGLLGISVLTVRTHRQRLMEKLELRNAAEITAYAVKLGLYNPS